jgi:flagellar hook-basal body complex protein FliE
MSTISSLTITPAGVSPSSAASAYGRVSGGADAATGATSGVGSFGNMLQRAMQGVVDAGHQADAQAVQGIAGHANLTEVVTAVSRAQLALQTTTAVRDRVVQAYQEILRMPI